MTDVQPALTKAQWRLYRRGRCGGGDRFLHHWRTNETVYLDHPLQEAAVALDEANRCWDGGGLSWKHPEAVRTLALHHMQDRDSLGDAARDALAAAERIEALLPPKDLDNE